MPAGIGFLAYQDRVKGVEENYNIMVSGITGNVWRLLSKAGL